MEPLLPVSLALYAEIHFRPIPGLCRLYRREPEVVTDIPWRLEPGVELPLLCLVKDADRFPVDIESVELTLLDRDGVEVFRRTEKLSAPVRDRLWWKVFSYDPPPGVTGYLWARVKVRLLIRGRVREVIGHNYRGDLSRLHRIYLSAENLPRKEGWRLGDIHHHSFYTDDMAEFGAPVPAAVRAARSLGFDWLAITDHSYDLDDAAGSR
jgi:hypothetical protein